MKKKIHDAVECIIQDVTFDLNSRSDRDLGFALYDYDAKTCITVVLFEDLNSCEISIDECDDAGNEHTLPIRLDSSSKLYNYWDLPFGKCLSLANFSVTSDVNELRTVLFYVFEYLHHRNKRLAKKQRKLQKQNEINAAWEEHEAINASFEARSYLKDFDKAELEWENRLAVLRRERRRKEILNLVNDGVPEWVACYIMFLQDKFAGTIDADVGFITYWENSEYKIDCECNWEWEKYLDADRETEFYYQDYHYHTEEDVEKWFDDHNKYLWDDYEEISYLEDFDDAERELARREVFEMVSNHGIDYLVDYIVDLREVLNHWNH